MSAGADLDLVIEHWPFHDFADAEDAGFGIVDDGRGEQAAEVADRVMLKCRRGHPRAWISGPGIVAEAFYFATRIEQASRVSIMNHRHDQAGGSGDGDARC